ncbi:MAG: tetratricopeptide repeat protein [Candidatus Celaenobacter polaris]|nr:tetratricopeptide repeat protein [Candidatus Celaenobacter polaris]
MTKTKSQLIIYLLLILIPIAVYWQCTSYEFVWDDTDPNLIENRYLQYPSFKNVLHFWTKPYAQMYIPVPYTAWALIKEIGSFLPCGQKVDGFNPFAFHLFSILFHIFNGIFIFKILKLLIKNDWSAFFGALIFLLHPLQVESVVWITEFRGLLAAFFGFSSLYILIKNEKLKESKYSKSGMTIRYINSLILFLFGMLSKPSVIVIPAFAFLIYLIYFKATFWSSFKKIIPFIIITIPFVLMLRFVQPASYHTEVAPLWSRFFIWMDTINFYILKTLIPYPLVVTYTRTFQTLLPRFWFYIEWIIPVLLVVFAARSYKKNPFILLGALIFIVGFLPVSGLVSFVFQKWSNVADRYMYFSMFGIALLTSWLLGTFTAKKVWIPTMCIILIFSVLTGFVQIPVWKDPLSLWSHALKHGKPNTFAYNNRGAAYNKLHEFDKAIADFNHALELNPQDASSYNNRGFAFSQTDQNDRALNDFDKALEYDPYYYEVYINRGNALKGKGEVVSALENYKKSLLLNSSQPKSYYNIGLVYAENEHPDSAIVYYNKAIEKLPNYTAAYLNRGNAYAGMGQLDKALENYNLVLNIDPSDEMAYSNRGILYFDTGKFREAIDDFSKALVLNPQRAQTYYLRGKVNFVEKNYTAALEDYNDALLLDETFVNAYIKRALLYAEGGNFKLAIDDINKAGSLSENNVEILIAKGDILSKQKFFSESAQAYTDAINLEPDQGILYQKRAVSFYFLGEYNKVRTDIQKAQNSGVKIPKSFLNAIENK